MPQSRGCRVRLREEVLSGVEEVLLEAATVLVRIDAVSSWRLEDTGKWSCRQVNNATWQCSTNGQQSTVLVFSARDQQAEPPRDDS